LNRETRYRQGYFDESYVYNEPFDAVVHSHVFEHIYDVTSFVSKLKNFIGKQKRLFFSVPNMFSMLQQKYSNTLCFEHTMLLTEEYIEYLLGLYGFSTERKKYFRDHSIFYACVRDDGDPIVLDNDLYERNKTLFVEYLDYYKTLIFNLNLKMEQTNRPIYLFGAHVFTQYLLGFGLNTAGIIGILDNAVSKQGKRLYGTNLMVYSPEILRNLESPVVILKAGIYNEEIKSDILTNINTNTEFWE
jgi:hypothetical protein